MENVYYIIQTSGSIIIQDLTDITKINDQTPQKVQTLG